MEHRERWVLVAGSLVALGAIAAAFRPVCVPLSAEALTGFNVPIEQRTDRDFYFQVFQKRGTQWYQCKTWVSRQFFY